MTRVNEIWREKTEVKVKQRLSWKVWVKRGKSRKKLKMNKNNDNERGRYEDEDKGRSVTIKTKLNVYGHVFIARPKILPKNGSRYKILSTRVERDDDENVKMLNNFFNVRGWWGGKRQMVNKAIQKQHNNIYWKGMAQVGYSLCSLVSL